MKHRKRIFVIALATFALPLVLGACSRDEVSSSRTSTVESDGSSRTKESTVTKSPDGTVTKEKSEETTPPTKP